MCVCVGLQPANVRFYCRRQVNRKYESCTHSPHHMRLEHTCYAAVVFQLAGPQDTVWIAHSRILCPFHKMAHCLHK